METTQQNHKCHLSQPTLILNSAWQPITIASVRSSICKVTSGLARFLEPDSYMLHDFTSWMTLEAEGDNYISMVRDKRIRVPEIVVLASYDRFPMKKVKLTRRNLLIRDGFRCQYTGKRVSGSDATIDHVIPQSRKGGNTWDNLVIASLRANAKKANKTPEEAGMKLLKRPTEPKWSPIYSKFSKVNLRSRHPESWLKFLPDKWYPEDYWDTELKS